MPPTTDTTAEMIAEHEMTAAALRCVFGTDADEMLARISFAYSTTLRSWRECVDAEVSRAIRLGFGR
jgi:hypothetical protein